MSLIVGSLKELWAKEFLPNIRKEIHKEIDSLKPRPQKKVERNWKVPKCYFKEIQHCTIWTIKDITEHSKGVESQIKDIKEDINKLGNDGFIVEVRLDELEQDAQRDCLKITSIPIVPNDSPALLVKEMSDIMGVNLNEYDILIAHRLPPTTKVKDRLKLSSSLEERKEKKFTTREKNQRSPVCGLRAGICGCKS